MLLPSFPLADIVNDLQQHLNRQVKDNDYLNHLMALDAYHPLQK